MTNSFFVNSNSTLPNSNLAFIAFWKRALHMFVYSAHSLLCKSVSMYCIYVNCFWSTLSRISLCCGDVTIKVIWFDFSFVTLQLNGSVGSFYKGALSSPGGVFSVCSTAVTSKAFIYQSPQKQRRIPRQICCAMTSLLLCPAGELRNTSERHLPCIWSSSGSLWKKLFRWWNPGLTDPAHRLVF